MRAIWLAALALGGLAATAAGQAVDRFADLPLRLNIGDAVMVDALSGVSFEGRLVRITPEQLAVAGPDARERVFAAAEVQRVRRRGDGLGNGMRLGALIGGAFGCGVFGAFSGEFRGGDCMSAILVFGGAGLGLGLLIDAANTGTTLVFTAPGTSVLDRRRDRGRLNVGATLSW